jgi:SAM-dependent methyltransferase
MTLTTQAQLIRRSVRAYRRNHTQYEDRHGEIFNEREQTRLHDELRNAFLAVTSSSAPPVALDLGCGTGNLTRHLLALGADVIAADVSPDFLGTVQRRYGSSARLRTALLNGEDLRDFADDTFDFVAAYSVLHHVPDYLPLIEDALRVLKPGGVIYLDHEVNQNYWDPPSELEDFRSALAATTRCGALWNPTGRRWQRFLQPSRYVSRARRAISPRYQAEGDIHVWPDDHIEWADIAETLLSHGAAIVDQRDYLVFRNGYPPDLYSRYAARCTDMTLLVARKDTACTVG